MKIGVLNISAPVRMTLCPPRLQLQTLWMGLSWRGKWHFGEPSAWQKLFMKWRQLLWTAKLFQTPTSDFVEQEEDFRSILGASKKRNKTTRLNHNNRDDILTQWRRRWPRLQRGDGLHDHLYDHYSDIFQIFLSSSSLQVRFEGWRLI